MTKYTLSEVKTAADRKRFLDMVDGIYAGCNAYIRPWDHDIEGVFDPGKNRLFEDGEAIRWLLCDQNGVVVGRIAAFYNRKSASQTAEQPTGGCGFFECIDSGEAAAVLFDAAREWLAARGMEAMDGPINFGQRSDWWGVLVEGFEFQPLYKNPYNLSYYKELFENYGFRNYFNQHSFIWRKDASEANRQIFARAERLYSTPGYRVEHLDMHNLEDAAENFRIIYNRAWALFSGVKPMSSPEALSMMRMLKPVLDPEIVFFAYFNDEPIGFFVTVPDLNRIIGKFNGKFGLWQKLRLMWDLKVRRKCDRIFGIIFGIAPEYHGKGVESAIMAEYWKYMDRTDIPYKTLELAWIGDFNPVMNRMIETYVCASRHKIHTTYRYLFDREKEFRRCPRLGVKRREE